MKTVILYATKSGAARECADILAAKIKDSSKNQDWILMDNLNALIQAVEQYKTVEGR